jgi:acetyl-CoA acyltransferase
VARKFGIARKDQDEFALRSHQRAAAAQQKGLLAAEILPITTQVFDADGNIQDVTIAKDEYPRADSTIEALAKLKPAFDPTGSVTAGNSSPLTDGAAAVVVTSGERAKALGVKPLGYFRHFAVAGVPPEIMGIGPKFAIPKVLKQVGLGQDDMAWIELNEAFAAQSLAVINDLRLDPAKINPLGGAIALGHPLGATGAIRTATIVHGLRRRKQKYGMVTMCIGTGMGAAGVFESIA